MGEPRTVAFSGLEIAWDPRVLEPRPWTAAQAEWAAELAKEAPEGAILELCCGAGQIGLLAATLSGRPLVQVDRDEVAADYARRNAERASVHSDIRIAPMERALGAEEMFPVIVADPPWLATAQVSTFPDDPVTAVDGGLDGFALIRMATDVAFDHLTSPGHLILQVGSDEQADALADLVGERGVSNGSLRLDRRRCSGGVLVHVARVPRP